METIRIETWQQFKEYILDEKVDYYRGEADASWHLHASLLRKERIEINYEVLISLVQKYKEVYDQLISARHSFSRFLFYLQHAISYSPFIDLSKNPWIALSFCLETVQRQSDRSIRQDASLYTFKWLDKEARWLKTHEAITSALEILELNGNRNKPVDAYIIDSYDLNILNDRMQYQQGAFLLLNYDHLAGDLEYRNDKIEIKKYVLSPSVQKELFFKLREEYPQYTIDYLYDPYKLFMTL